MKRGPRAASHWTLYLEFHNIKRALGLSTASLVAFLVGMVCLIMAGIAVGMIYSVQTFNDFQAVQLYRMQWLLGAIAAFAAGLLLKKSPDARSAKNTTTHVGPDALVRAGEQSSPRVSVLQPECNHKTSRGFGSVGRVRGYPPTWRWWHRPYWDR